MTRNILRICALGVLGSITLALLAPFPFATASAPAQDGYPFCLRCDAPDDCYMIMCPVSPSPTETPTDEPTLTATPTFPPVSTYTPTPAQTATETQEPTPTAELTLPPTQQTQTPTPSPQPPTATPQPGKCWGVTTDGLNVRTEPYGTLLGSIPAESQLTLESIWYDDNGVIWYGHYWLPEQGGYSHSAYIEIAPEQESACDDLPDVTPPQEHNAALLWHTVPGFNVGNAQVSYGILQDKSIAFGLKPYAGMSECIDALNRGGICIYRHGAPDCPNGIGTDDPVQSARDFLQHGIGARDNLAGYQNAFYEPVNECLYGNATDVRYLHWWAQWLAVYVPEAYALGYPKLVVPTLGPGHGEPIMWQIWKPALELNDSHGGLFGEHAYAPIPNCGGDGSLAQCDPYCACRHRTNEADRQSIGLSINVAITEAARGFGNDPAEVSDFCEWYEIVRGDEWLHSVSLWTAGYNPTWPNANLDQYMVPIAGCVR